MSDRLKIVGVVPVRMASTRFPGKPLHPIAGKPMLQHVLERAARARALDELLVATEDEEVVRLVTELGFPVVRTGPAASGGDRVAQVAAKLDADVVVNIQGDEPLLDPAVLDALVRPYHEWVSVQVTTLARPFAPDEDPHDPNRVKVVTEPNGRALYFSRSPIPHGGPYRLHIGLYAYWRHTLLRFRGWDSTFLERAERLEQLRFLEHGVPVHVIEVDWRGVGVDTPADAAEVEDLLKSATL